MSLLQPNKVQSIFFLLQFRVRSVAICLPFFLSIYTCHLFWVRACFIWVRLQFYAIHVIFEAIQLPVDQYWNKLRVLGVAIWTDVWVSRGYFFPPLPLMLCLALPSEGSQVSWKKTQSFGFNLILFLQWKTTCK